MTVVDNIFVPQDAERVFRELASQGHKLIFGTSFTLGSPMQRIAPRFPDVAFEHCSGLVHLDNLGTFEAKYFEGSYVAGVAAGHMTKTGKLGFVGGFPIPDILITANAFLLGAQSVNPNITCDIVFLNSWFDPAKEKESALALIAQGADALMAMTDTSMSVQTAQEGGIWSVGYASDLTSFGPDSLLTSVILDWSSDYLAAARGVVNGNWSSEVRWNGFDTGVVKLGPYNEAIPAEIQAEMTQLRDAIGAGTAHPFAGEIKDSDGAVRVAAGEILPDSDIRSFDWLVAGMNGKLS